MKIIKKFNGKVNIDFYNLLISSEYFKQTDYWKLIYPCWKICNNIYHQYLFNGTFNTPSRCIAPYFKGFDIEYVDVLKELQKIGIIPEIDWNYRFGWDASQYNESRQYFLSEQVMNWMDIDNEEYLVKLHSDKPFRRKELQNKNKRKNDYKPQDIVLDTNYFNIHNLVYDLTDIDTARNLILNSDRTDKEKTHSLKYLRYAAKRLTTDINVEYYDDGRIHNCFNQCPKELRNLLKIKHNGGTILKNRFNVDYRAMHPSFLGLYLINLYNNYNPITSTTIVEKADMTQNETLLKEYNKWNELWFGEVHPRKTLSELWHLDDKAVKNMLLVDINEPKNYPTTFKTWFKNEYPTLHNIWKNSKKEETGVNISNFIERELLRDTQFYMFLNNITGIKFMDCHDGLSVFCSKSTTKEDLEKVIDYQINLCYTKFAIKLNKNNIKIEEVL